jgi:hypothetical protein
MDLREKAAGMRARLLASMGRLDVVQGEINGGQVKAEAGQQDHQYSGQQDQQQWWPPLPPGRSNQAKHPLLLRSFLPQTFNRTDRLGRQRP